MPRTSWKVLSSLTLGLLLLQAALAGAQNTPSSAPPKLERIEDGSDTPITVTAKPGSDKKITEKREQGKVTEVKVKSGKSEYTMKPNTPAGNGQPGDVQSNATRAPQWQVMEFNLNKKKKEEASKEAASTPAPPPPSSAPAK
ncbi:MAG: hypothetical protein V4582_22500 [Pseudomonadota bacterium]